MRMERSASTAARAAPPVPENHSAKARWQGPVNAEPEGPPQGRHDAFNVGVGCFPAIAALDAHGIGCAGRARHAVGLVRGAENGLLVGNGDAETGQRIALGGFAEIF